MWLSASSHTGTSTETGRKHELKGVNYQRSSAIIKVYVCFGYEDTIAILLMRGFAFFILTFSQHAQATISPCERYRRALWHFALISINKAISVAGTYMFWGGIRAGGVYSFTVEAGLLFSGTSPSEKQNTCLSGFLETCAIFAPFFVA